jgi:hypothetical protein
MAGDVKKMVVGFNHNIKHKGKMYHIQTEDSGLENPHIITHLFVGGNILASKKTSYADIVGADNLAQVVRELMEEQHKEMLRNLINGVYDDIDSEYAQHAQSYQPGQIHADLVDFRLLLHGAGGGHFRRQHHRRGHVVDLHTRVQVGAARDQREAGHERGAEQGRQEPHHSCPSRCSIWSEVWMAFEFSS